MSFFEQLSFELETLEEKMEHLGNSSVQNKSDFHQNVFRANAISTVDTSTKDRALEKFQFSN
jgi:hypothetical protein